MKLNAKTSGVSLHFEKHKGGVNGLQRHNEREPGQKHSNERIKDERTKDNVFLKKSDGTYSKQIDSIIAQNRDGGLKGVRKDAVRMVEATVQLSGQVLDRDEAEQEHVLRQSYDWLRETFGEENILSAVIHKDETNMHMHLDFVPIRDGKLNAKTILARNKLQQYQNEFLKFLQESEPSMNFKRGGGEYNGLSQQVFETLQDERRALLEEVEDRENELDERETALDKREKTLAKKERSLTKREKKLTSDSDKLDSKRKETERMIVRAEQKTNEQERYMQRLKERETELEKDRLKSIESQKRANEEWNKVHNERAMLTNEKQALEERIGAFERDKRDWTEKQSNIEKNVLKIQITASDTLKQLNERIDTFNKLLERAKTPMTRERLNKAVAQAKPLPHVKASDFQTEKGQQDLANALDILNSLQLDDGLLM